MYPLLDILVGTGQMVGAGQMVYSVNMTYPLRVWRPFDICKVCNAMHSTEQCVNTDIRFQLVFTSAGEVCTVKQDI